MKAVGIYEAVVSSHHSRAPATHNRGILPIDSIYISAGLNSSQSGFTPFLEPVSDHRATWIDFGWNQLLGHHPLLIKRPSVRRLQCDNPFTVRKYNDLLHKYCKDSHLEEQLANLTLNTNQITLQAEINRLDSMHTESMLNAERQCRKIHMGNVPFYPEIYEAALQIIYWKTFLRKVQGAKINSRVLLRLKKKEKNTLPTQAIISHEIQSQIKSSQETYQQLKLNSSTLRITWLDRLSCIKAETNNNSAEKELQKIKRHEEIRMAARYLHRISGKNNREPIAEVIEEVESIPTTIRDPEVIEKACLRHNAKLAQTSR